METAGQVAKDVLSELQAQSQTSTQELKKVDMPTYCAKCNYPIYENNCIVCERENRRKKDIVTAHMLSLGGLRAYCEFTEAKFIVNENNKTSFDAAKSFNPDKENYYFYGPTGSGKSHLAIIAARKHLGDKLSNGMYANIDTGVEVVKPTNILREIRMADNAGEEESILSRLTWRRVLVIDDLGTEKITEFAATTLYEIMDARYMNAGGGLIITSNLSLGQLSEKLGDDRIPSRLAHMCRVFSLAKEPDYRLFRLF